MTKVEGSTSIAAYEYNAKTEKLTVEFLKSQGTYVFHDVPEVVLREFEAAESKGKYFHSYIRGRYRYFKQVAMVSEDIF